MTLEIRFAEASDEAQWRPLWDAYLTFSTRRMCPRT